MRQTMRMARTGAGTLLLLLGAGAWAAACGKGEAKVATPAEAVVLGPENLAIASETTLSDGPMISGALTAEREARIRAELSGVVLLTRVEPGTPVRAGQVLAEIDPTTAREAVFAARAALRSAETARDLARRNAERSERLATAGAVAERALEDDRRVLAQAEAGVADAQARLTGAEQQLAKATVRAPFAGIVSERQASAGDVVQPGTALVTVVDPASLRLEATVPADALGRLRLGAPVQFGLSGSEGTPLRGTLTRISPAVDPATRQVRVQATVPNPGRSLVAGLFAEGRIATAQKRATAVPAGAVDENAASPHVHRVKGGRVEQVPVTVGLRDGLAELVEVAGVAPGDTVLLKSAQGLPAGTPVQVRKD